MSISLRDFDSFEKRHNGPSESEISAMLHVIGTNSLDQLISQTIPTSIRLKNELNLPKAQSEAEFLRSFKNKSLKNRVFTSYIGAGYHDTVTPTVVLRNILENPGWYTAYTPYQAEISQGRLEMLLNYQTMICDLTGMELANASLLDESTAAAEAMNMLHSVTVPAKKGAHTFLVSTAAHPQTIDLLTTRANPLGIDLELCETNKMDVTRPDVFGVLIQNPDTFGQANDLTAFTQSAKENNVLVAVATDIMSLVIMKSPGSMGADVVLGSTQRFGVPMGYGGPHAAFFATKEAYKRQIPGRIIGVTKDAEGNHALRMALQTREQHIRREKATSNICTAQVLLSVMAAAYAVYHGPEGLKGIAERIHGKAVLLESALSELGFEQVNSAYFDTLNFKNSNQVQLNEIKKLTEQHEINLRYFENGFSISVDEAKTVEDISLLISIFEKITGKSTGRSESVESKIPSSLVRKEEILTHPFFSSYQAEHEMLRYLKRLENKDISLVHSMISLGSCTMKLNATTEMIPITWTHWAQLHPFAPTEQVLGYQDLIAELSAWLCEITGFTAMSLQPNSGAQGEYTGLMSIRAYHKDRNETQRTVAIIPSSAHGTNPASAVMAGMKVVVTKCDEKGNIDVADLREKAELHKDNLACLMVTYPSTHGVFEEEIREICDIIHERGGLVYMDGANMNAQVGLTSPAEIGADVCHLNLHKTFCIPHGGGGPGIGPIGVNDKLKPYLPGHSLVKTGGEKAITAVSGAPYGSADILGISYAYIAMMGGNGLKRATQMAILNANYIKARLEKEFKILFTGKNGRAAHEMIVDFRPFKVSAGIEVTDVAKRLMDYGFHAPTVSFPVAGTVMIEPTESESKAELDRFCDAMLQIREEIREIENGTADKMNNVLKNAPHTAHCIISDNWIYPYSREKAAYPLDFVRETKIWPTVRRIDDAYGDRNLICSCLPVEAYA
ncbi:MAG: aminomethyl-transferring glycine dehydrogenase [Bacteroidetes bacterium]|nr:aminomethyl-transferring glycine dehydrogenase [Bacteroidota bacterium]